MRPTTSKLSACRCSSNEWEEICQYWLPIFLWAFVLSASKSSSFFSTLSNRVSWRKMSAFISLNSAPPLPNFLSSWFKSSNRAFKVVCTTFLAFSCCSRCWISSYIWEKGYPQTSWTRNKSYVSRTKRLGMIQKPGPWLGSETLPLLRWDLWVRRRRWRVPLPEKPSDGTWWTWTGSSEPTDEFHEFSALLIGSEEVSGKLLPLAPWYFVNRHEKNIDFATFNTIIKIL